MNRLFQLIGLLLIAVLAMRAEAVAQEPGGDDEEPVCWDFDGCHSCLNDTGTWITYWCPLDHPEPGAGIVCWD